MIRVTAPGAGDYRAGRDAADPSGDFTQGQGVACGYASGMAEHVWSPAQWDAQAARYRLPIHVVNPYVSAVLQAQQLVLALTALKAPAGIVVAADLETLAVPPGILDPIADEVSRISTYRVCPYGSTSSLFRHSPQAGYWVADPTGIAHVYGHPDVIGTQWAWGPGQTGGGDWDENLFAPQAALRLWDTRPDPEPGTEQVVPAGAWTRLDGTDAEVLSPRAVRLRVKAA